MEKDKADVKLANAATALVLMLSVLTLVVAVVYWVFVNVPAGVFTMVDALFGTSIPLNVQTTFGFWFLYLLPFSFFSLRGK